MSAKILRGLAISFISIVYLINSDAGDFFVKKLLFQPPEEYIEDKSIIKNSENCWLHIKSGKSDTIIVFLHGNASDISMNKDTGKILSDIGDVYIPEYDGYGAMRRYFPRRASDGIMDSLRNFFDTVIKPQNKIVYIVGQSLGSHYATRLASEGYCTHLCLISPFYSIEKLAFDNKEKPVLKGEISYNTGFYIGKINSLVKITIMHGENDKLVPPSHSHDLYREITMNAKRLCIVGGHCHSSINFIDVLREMKSHL
jgi:esterase/lipase